MQKYNSQKESGETPQKLTHAEKARALRAIGFRRQVQGRVKNATKADKAFVTKLYNQFKDPIEKPEFFERFIVRSAASKKLSEFSAHGKLFVPRFAADKVIIDNHRVRRETLKVTDKGHVKRMVEIELFHPGNDLEGRMLAAIDRGMHITRPLFARIAARPFALTVAYDDHEDFLSQAYRYIQDWEPQNYYRDIRGSKKKKAEIKRSLLRSLSIVYYENVTGPATFYDESVKHRRAEAREAKKRERAKARKLKGKK